MEPTDGAAGHADGAAIAFDGGSRAPQLDQLVRNHRDAGGQIERIDAESRTREHRLIAARPYYRSRRPSTMMASVSSDLRSAAPACTATANIPHPAQRATPDLFTTSSLIDFSSGRRAIALPCA